ncbi:MAG: PP2C family protein-serine/threonine phosphatase [Pyrinomonadaceae bacterium]
MEDTNELISASISDRGLSEKRPQNEDSFAELPQFGVFAVADGVGGAQAGDFASQMAMELLTEAVSNQTETVDAEELFRIAIEHANRSIHQMAADVPQLSTMATTIVALHLKENIATLAHVGDSRIYRFTPDGAFFRETDDHSVVEEEVRAGRMTQEEAAVHPSRNVISRALGAESTVEIDFKTIMIEPNTTFMLCSDGITRHIPDEELKAIFASGAQPQLICEHLKEVCYSRGAEDNLTAVIVRTFAEAAKESDDLYSTIPVLDEETVASARSAYAAAAGDTIEITADDDFGEIEFGEREPEADLLEETVEPQLEDSAEIESKLNEEPPQIEEELPSIVEEPPQIVEELPAIVEPIPEAYTDEQFLLTEPEETTLPDSQPLDLSAYTSSSVVVPAQRAEPEPEVMIFGSQNRVPNVVQAQKESSFGRIMFSLGLLVLGGIIAVGATYMLGLAGSSEPEPVPQIETMKTQNIPLTSFEETRRTVDKDPEAYQTKTSNITPRDAVDHYFLGRAMLLTGKPNEARRQFADALAKLSDVDESDRKSLQADISLALAVIDSQQASENFNKAIVNSQPPTNSNAAIPIR